MTQVGHLDLESKAVGADPFEWDRLQDLAPKGLEAAGHIADGMP